jgi:hypothetical protein
MNRIDYEAAFKQLDEQEQEEFEKWLAGWTSDADYQMACRLFTGQWNALNAQRYPAVSA